MYQKANDRSTLMTELGKCLVNLEADGYTDQYQIVNGRLHSLKNEKTYLPKDVTAMNFYRFEGISNPDDMSILYAVETIDGGKGTLIDAYGLYADAKIGEFMKEVEIHKSVHDVEVY